MLYFNITFYMFAKKKIVAFKHYYQEFMEKLTDDERSKIRRALLLLETEEKIPYHYIKYIRDGIYEFRVTYKTLEFRIMHMYDGNRVIILLNCFCKKTQKTPHKEIEKALRLKKEYYETYRK